MLVLAFVTPSTHVIGVANSGYPPTATPTATATPHPIPTATFVPTAGVWPTTLSSAQMGQALREAGWPEAAIPAALRVFWCESGYNRFAIGLANEIGLSQLHPQWHMWRFDGDPFHPVVNLRAALSLYNETGWSEWTCKP